MSEPLLIALTVLELVLLVAVLAIYLVILARRLRSIADTLAVVVSAVQAFDQEVEALPGGVAQLNWELEQLAAVLPDVAGKAEALAGGR